MAATPADISAAWAKITSLCDLGRFDEAAEAAGRLVGADPADGHAWALLARANLGRRRYDTALDAARRAQALAPDEAWPHRLASIALSRLGKPEAVDAARRAVALAPHSAICHANLAEILLADRRRRGRAARRREALQNADRALALAPDDPHSHAARGRAAAAVRRRREAVAAFRRALELDPQNVGAHNELARYHLRRSGFRPTALSWAANGFADTVRADPQEPAGRSNLELTLRAFLLRVAALLFLDGALSATIAASEAAWAAGSVARMLPLLLLVVPAAFAGRFLTGLSATVRRGLYQVMRRKLVLAAEATLALSVLLLVIDAFAPASQRAAWALGVIGAPWVGLGLMALEERTLANARREFTTPQLWDFVATLMLFAFLLFALVTFDGPVPACIGVVLLGGAALLIRKIRQRRRRDTDWSPIP